MLPSIVKLSLRAIRGAELARVVDVRSTLRRGRTGWVSRRPVAILNEHELHEEAENTKELKEVHKKAARTVRKERLKVQKAAKKEEKEEKESEEVTSELPIYKALKEDDKLISSLMINIKTKKKREKNNLILLEGLRLIEDAIQSGAKPKVIFFSRLSDILPLSLPKGVDLYKIPYRTIQLWSNLTTSPGVLGIFEIPNVEAKRPADDAIPLTIICDNVREPGNLGSIIRIAAAVGCEKLLLMKGCVDLWEPKVLRSAAGAHFRLPIFTSLTWDEIPMLISDESEIFLADNSTAYEAGLKNDTDNKELDTSTSDEVECIVEKDVEKDSSDENVDSCKNDEISQLMAKSTKPTMKTKLLVKKIISQLPVVPYDTLNFSKKEMVLVTGGETEGVSLRSCELLRARNCTRVNISLTNGVDSLNATSAISIISFEMKRQFINHKISE